MPLEYFPRLCIQAGKFSPPPYSVRCTPPVPWSGFQITSGKINNFTGKRILCVRKLLLLAEVEVIPRSNASPGTVKRSLNGPTKRSFIGPTSPAPRGAGEVGM